MNLQKPFAMTLTIAALMTSLAACQKNEVVAEKGPAEKAGQQLDQAMIKASEQLSKAAEQAGKELQAAGEKIQSAAQEAQKKE